MAGAAGADSLDVYELHVQCLALQRRHLESAAPGFRPCHYWLAAALVDAGRAAEAKQHAKATLQTEPTFRARDPMPMQLYQRTDTRKRMANVLERAGCPR